MSDDLRKLIEAVEAGTPDNFGAVKLGHPLMRGYAESAHDGSLDAAVALLEALLPEWWARQLAQTTCPPPPAPCCWRPCVRYRSTEASHE